MRATFDPFRLLLISIAGWLEQGIRAVECHGSNLRNTVMNLAKNTVSRREFLAQAGAGLVSESKRLIIDTHLEVWTIDPRFPIHHPEHAEEKPEISAPIENEVEETREYGLRYAVLINPRVFGWDNSYISYSLHKYSDRFVAHGLINPEGPKIVERLRYWVCAAGIEPGVVSNDSPEKLSRRASSDPRVGPLRNIVPRQFSTCQRSGSWRKSHARRLPQPAGLFRRSNYCQLS
jgi:hypothetical protein